MHLEQCQTASEEHSLIKGLYYQLRGKLYQWTRAQCLRFKLQRQTYANSVFLLDQYFKNHQLNKQSFMKIGLCLMIISTKAFETKVLFTKSIAKNNGMNEQQMCNIQLGLIRFFGFRVSTYNFVRLMNEYLKRWDCLQASRGIDSPPLLFFHDCLESYLLYQEIYYLCQNQLKHNKSLLQQRLKQILKFVLRQKCGSEHHAQLSHDVDLIFIDQFLPFQQENLYVYEKTADNGSQAQLSLWRQSFLELIPLLKKRYQSRNREEQSYGQFLSLLI